MEVKRVTEIVCQYVLICGSVFASSFSKYVATPCVPSIVSVRFVWTS